VVPRTEKRFYGCPYISRTNLGQFFLSVLNTKHEKDSVFTHHTHRVSDVHLAVYITALHCSLVHCSHAGIITGVPLIRTGPHKEQGVFGV
jgi:hypothetical protein